MHNLRPLFLLVLSPLLLAGCAATAPTIGDTGAKTVATGAAGGANASGANRQLERCEKTLGTLAIVEEANQPWTEQLFATYKTRTLTQRLRLIVQQSNCFVIVERGAAFRQMQGERELAKSGELRGNSKMGKGQMVAADYTMTPTVTFSQKGTAGVGGFIGGNIGAVASLVAGNLRKNEASTVLLLTDNRSGIQLAAAEGSAANWDMGVMAGFFAGGGAGAGGFSNTPEGKVLTVGFMDSYNQMVRAVRSYKAQSVEGGLGTGGVLKTN